MCASVNSARHIVCGDVGPSMVRWVPTSLVAALLVACGPTVATSATNGGSSSGAEESSASAGSASTEVTGESTATSTGAETPMPLGCDPRFDSGRPAGEVHVSCRETVTGVSELRNFGTSERTCL